MKAGRWLGGGALTALLLGAVPLTASAQSASERGEQALEAGELDSAAAAYREALSQNPHSAEALNGLGSALFRQGRRAEAVAQFNAAIAADPDFKLAHFNLGYAARKSEDFATAAKAYERYTHLDPGDPDGFFGLAESYRQLGQAQRAVSAYQAYLARERRPSEQRWVEKAREQLAQLQGAPTPGAGGAPTVSTLLAEGDRLKAEKRYPEAAQTYQQVLSLEPSQPEALFKLGALDAMGGRFPEAIARWNRVLAVSTDAAVRKSAEGNIARARAKLAAAPPAPATPNDLARTTYEEGVRRVAAGDYTSALGMLSQAIRLAPGLSVAYVARGSARLGLRDFAGAAEDYRAALSLEPSRAAPLYGLAESYRAQGRVSDARSLYEKYSLSSAPDVRPQLQADSRQKAALLR